jgi:hypothetical protein
MKQEIQVLPVECKRCGTLFDLWYDLQQSELVEEGMSKTKVRDAQSFCWRCRQVVLDELEDDIIEGEDSDEFTFSFE